MKSNPKRVPPFCKALSPVALAVMVSLPAQALTINLTYADTYSAAQQAELNTAINFYQTSFSDNMTLNIKMLNSGAGLGSTSQNYYQVDYGTWRAALAADATSANDTTAVNSIPAANIGDPSPVPGTDNKLIINRAAALAVGLSVGSQTDGITTWDADMDLNLALMSTNHANPGATPTLYDLRSVFMHELNEVLGTPSNLGGFGGNNSFFAGHAAPMDLFRYTSTGGRSFTTAGDDAYFSINGGTSTLVRFNQGLNGSGGDYSDFWSGNGSGNAGNNPPYQIQDAFSYPGKAAEMGVETVMLDVIGFNLITPVPEPQTYAMMLMGLGALSLVVRRRQA